MGYLDDEVDRINEDPRSSPADRRAAESFKLTIAGKWRGEVNQVVAQRRAANDDKRSSLYNAVREEQKEIDANARALDAGEISIAEFMNRRRRHLGKVNEFERRYAGLESSDQLIADMAADPVGYMENFFEKWTVLRDKRPSIDAWIDHDRSTRKTSR